MCSKPKPPPDPRKKDPEFLAVAKELGIVNKKGDPVLKNNNQIYTVQKEIDNRQLAASKAEEAQKTKEYNDRLDRMDATNASNRRDDIARVESQFAATSQAQQAQYEASMAAQERALQAQLAAQAELQRKSEEAALRSQVPQMTNNASNASRIRSRSSSKQQARRASLGTSQLRVPLSIGGSMGGMSNGGSPVKLNIGS
jgi:hypothetical protein